jgi:hypothetical protein
MPYFDVSFIKDNVIGGDWRCRSVLHRLVRVEREAVQKPRGRQADLLLRRGTPLILGGDQWILRHGAAQMKPILPARELSAPPCSGCTIKSLSRLSPPILLKHEYHRPS